VSGASGQVAPADRRVGRHPPRPILAWGESRTSQGCGQEWGAEPPNERKRLTGSAPAAEGVVRAGDEPAAGAGPVLLAPVVVVVTRRGQLEVLDAHCGQ